MTKEIPPEWKTTPLARSLVDFEIMLASEQHGPFFRSLETIQGLFEEQKRLTARIYALYLLTFAGACLVLSGPLPPEAKVAAIGLEAPISAIPQQIIAVATAVAFGIYAQLIASLGLLSNMIRHILEREGYETWHFFGARFDASDLWTVLITPRYIGYGSPKRHKALVFPIFGVAILSTLIHAFIILTSSAMALQSAWLGRTWYLKTFSVISLPIVTISILSLVIIVFLRLPFRFHRPQKPQKETVQT